MSHPHCDDGALSASDGPDFASRSPFARRSSHQVAIASIACALALTAITACGSSGTKATSKGSTPTSVTAPPTTVAKKPLPPFTDDPTVACSFDSPDHFPASVITGPAGAENGPSPAAKALHDGLAQPNHGLLDNNGQFTEWRLAKETATSALFLGSGGGTRQANTYEKKGEHWGWVGSHPCNSATVMFPGLNVVAINLDTDTPVTPQSTTVKLQVTELSCTGGVPLTEDRIAGPQVHTDADRVIISVAAQPVPGEDGKSCVAAMPITIEVKLDKPLGSRKLLNGTRFPLQPIN